MLMRVFDVEPNTDGIIVQKPGVGHFRNKKTTHTLTHRVLKSRR
jgi:hypothetical protein